MHFGWTRVIVISSIEYEATSLQAAFMGSVADTPNSVIIEDELTLNLASMTALALQQTLAGLAPARSDAYVFVLLCNVPESTTVLLSAASMNLTTNSSYMWVGGSSAIMANSLLGNQTVAGMIGVRSSIVPLAASPSIEYNSFNVSSMLQDFALYWQGLLVNSWSSIANTQQYPVLLNVDDASYPQTEANALLSGFTSGSTISVPPLNMHTVINDVQREAEIYSTDNLLRSNSRQYGVIDPSVANTIDAVFAVAAALTKLSHNASISSITPAMVSDMLNSVSFFGASGPVAFSQGERLFVSYDVVNQHALFSRQMVVIGRWYSSSFAPTTSTIEWPAGGEPSQADWSWSTVKTTASPLTTTCGTSVVVPAVSSVVVFIILIALMFLCGRRRVDASVFELTAEAERSAQVAIHEAEVKSSFLANMSHEIRTPLHAILSMSRMLMDSKHSNTSATQQELEDLSHIIKASETLEALVNDILFISKMQTASFELNNAPMNVCELMEDITQLLALRWATKTVEAVTELLVPEFSYEVG